MGSASQLYLVSVHSKPKNAGRDAGANPNQTFSYCSSLKRVIEYREYGLWCTRGERACSGAGDALPVGARAEVG